jgi:hypothetical protein
MNIESVAIYVERFRTRAPLMVKRIRWTVYSLYNEYSSMRGMKVSLMIYRTILGDT